MVHLIIVAALIYGSMHGTGENDSITSRTTNVVTIASSADIRRPLPTGENSTREIQGHMNLPSARRNVHRETPTLEHRTLEAVLPPQTTTVLDSHSLSLVPKEMGLTLPESIPVIKPITPGEAFVTPQFDERANHRSGRAIINRFTPRANSSNEIVSLVSQLSLLGENFEKYSAVAREKHLQMQASMHAISNSCRRLRAIRSVQEFDAYSLAQLRRVARSVGQHPLLISRCNPSDLHELLSKHWTPIVMLRSLVGGTHPWVITSWETEAGQIT